MKGTHWKVIWSEELLFGIKMTAEKLQRRERCSDALWQDGKSKRLFSDAKGFGSVLQ